jgi:hypothetical protein
MVYSLICAKFSCFFPLKCLRNTAISYIIQRFFLPFLVLKSDAQLNHSKYREARATRHAFPFQLSSPSQQHKSYQHVE